MVRVVAAPRGHDDVAAHGLGGRVIDFGIGVGHGEDDRIRRHGCHHLRRQHALRRATHEDIGARHDVPKGARRRRLLELLFVDVHAFGSALVDQALGVAEPQVVQPHARRDHHVGARDGRGPRATEDHLHVAEVLADQLRGVEERGGADDGGAMLVIVEYRDIHLGLETTLDLETFRRLDVLQVDAAESGFQRFYNLYELFWVRLIHFNIEHINVRKALEENTLSLHHRLASQSADISQAQYSRAVGDHRHQISLGRVLVGILGILLDLEAGFCHAGGVSQRQVPGGAGGLGGNHLYFPPAPLGVVIKGFLLSDHVCSLFYKRQVA